MLNNKHSKIAGYFHTMHMYLTEEKREDDPLLHQELCQVETKGASETACLQVSQLGDQVKPRNPTIGYG